MKVLMFGWEYPPHVFGGLATANYGISESRLYSASPTPSATRASMPAASWP